MGVGVWVLIEMYYVTDMKWRRFVKFLKFSNSFWKKLLNTRFYQMSDDTNYSMAILSCNS